jgi:hypothetical protein
MTRPAPGPDATAWRRGAGERRTTARLLSHLGRQGWRSCTTWASPATTTVTGGPTSPRTRRARSALHRSTAMLTVHGRDRAARCPPGRRRRRGGSGSGGACRSGRRRRGGSGGGAGCPSALLHAPDDLLDLLWGDACRSTQLRHREQNRGHRQEEADPHLQLPVPDLLPRVRKARKERSVAQEGHGSGVGPAGALAGVQDLAALGAAGNKRVVAEFAGGAVAAPCFAWPWTSHTVESRSIVIGPSPGPAPAVHARATTCSASRSSWRTCRR